LNVQYTDSLSGQLNDMLSALDKVMIVLILVAGMLSFVVLYNLNNINIGFSAFVNWIMYFKLKKIDMVESLKSVE
jgi:hypothetical protein